MRRGLRTLAHFRPSPGIIRSSRPARPALSRHASPLAGHEVGHRDAQGRGPFYAFSTTPCAYVAPSPTSNADAGDVRKAHEFDRESLQQYLASTIPEKDFAGMEIKQFLHGQSNPTFLVQLKSGEKLVVRKQPPGKLLRGAHAVDREFQAMSALRSRLPVPSTLTLCTDPAVIGTPFFVYTFAEGRLLKDGRLPEVPVEDRRAVYQSMAEALAQLHSVDPQEVGLSDFGRGEGFIARQTKVWSKQFEAAKTHEIPAMEKLMKWLPGAIPKDDHAQSIVHGDFRIDNLIFEHDSPKVAAVLDWELSTIGHPASDLAYNCMPYHMPSFPGLPMSGFGDINLSESGIPSEEEYLKMYLASGPRSGKHGIQVGPDGLPANWHFFLAFSFFRSASILQGVYKRSLAGIASAENAAVVGKLAADMADIGWHHACLHEAEVAKANHNGIFGAGTVEELSQVPKSKISTSDWPVPTFPPPSDRAKDLLHRVREFVSSKVVPIEREVLNYQYTSPDRWTVHHPEIERLKAEAKAEGLWNLFLPQISDPEGKYGANLTNLEYAPMAEETGRSLIAPEVFNCSAPDTGNMEVLVMYGSEEQQRQWLDPLLEGSIRSCFAMTEPAVASSDATNMQATIEVDGDEVVLNGRKWWISGATDPRCKVAIFMGRDLQSIREGKPRHQQHSMVLVPMNAPGVTIHRPLGVIGFDDAPHGHAEMSFENVRLPATSVILGPGRGFEIAQGRLGPGRIHHCMRLIGAAERALDLMVYRVHNRTAFGKPLVQQGTILAGIANSRIEIDQARLLTFQAAAKMDASGNKAAKDEIAAIKIAAPRMASTVIDRAIQAHGAAGLCTDLPLGHHLAWARVLRLADGPDEVHMAALGKSESRRG